MQFAYKEDFPYQEHPEFALWLKKNYGTTDLLQVPNDPTADLPDLHILKNLINLNAVSIHGPGESSKKKKHKTNKKNTNKNKYKSTNSAYFCVF